MSHIFISYSKHDIVYASYLRGLLRSAGFTVWMDEARLEASDYWWRTIEYSIQTCAAFIVIMTPDARQSDWVEREILLAEKPENRKPIFPLLVAGEAWSRLANVQYEDLRGEKALKLPPRLIQALSRAAPVRAHDAPTIPHSSLLETQRSVKTVELGKPYRKTVLRLRINHILHRPRR